MSKTSGYIVFPEDFLPDSIEFNVPVKSRSKYEFLTGAISTGKTGRIYLPGTGTFTADYMNVGAVEGYLISSPGQNVILLPYAAKVDGIFEYGIIFNSLG